jgi:predicted cobalt transporter CbtA
MVRSLLIRGMLVGALAGLLVFAFGKFFGEPQLERAISFETSLEQAKEKAEGANGINVEDEPALVSRHVQAGWGLFTGVFVYAAAFGGLFALVFAAVQGRAVDLSPRATSAVLAAVGFISVYLVPNLKYPASPPAVGEPATIGYRTALYFSMLALSVAAMVLASMLRKRLVARRGAWTAALTACACYLIAMIVVAGALPAINEVPDTFPAVVLWQFRVASCGMQLIMWTTLGLVFGALTERAWVKDGGSYWLSDASSLMGPQSADRRR